MQVYVVYMGEKQNTDISVASVQQNLHYPILERVLGRYSRKKFRFLIMDLIGYSRISNET